MGLFSRKKKVEDLTQYGPLLVNVLSCDSKSVAEIVVRCEVKCGRVGKGEVLIYKPVYGRETMVNIVSIEAMMMSMEQAMEGTVVTLVLSGCFDMLDAGEGDRLVRE